MSRRFVLRCCIGVLAMAMVLISTPIAVPTQAAQARAAEPVTLRVALTQDVDSFNPFRATLSSTTEIGRLMYDFLTAYDAKDQQPVAGLATDWKYSQDRLTWTYTIRDNAKWSDGKPITAKDVAFTYNLMLDNEQAREANGNFVANFDTVSAPDDTTLVVKTKKPQATMLALDIPIVPEHIWSGVDNIADYKNEPVDGKPVVSSGPFQLAEYRAGQFIRLKANKNYWRGAPKIDELQFVNFDQPDGAVAALRSGDIDLVNNLTSEQYESLQGEDDIKLNRAEGRRFTSLLLNPGAATGDGERIGDGNPALRDVRVRQAIAGVINIKTIVDQVYGGFAEPGASTVPAVFTDWHWQPGAEQRAVDPEASKKLLDDAGWKPGADGVRSKNGEALELRLIARNDKPLDQAAARYIVDWLGDIGIRVNYSTIDSGRLDEATTAGQYDLSFSGYGVNPDPDYVLGIQTCGSRPDAQGESGNSSNYFCDETYDKLYAEQTTTFDKAQRVELVKQMQQRVYEQVPEIQLVYQNVLEAYRADRFNAFQTQPDPGGQIMAQNGFWGYYSADPTELARTGDSSINTGLVVLIVLGGLVVVGVVVLLVVRGRRRTAHERE